MDIPELSRFCALSISFILLGNGGFATAQQWRFALPLQTQAQPVQPGQPAPPKKLNIVIVEGEGALNNIRQRVAREPIVQVEDENRRPVAGAVVTFFLPNQGPSAVFANGGQTLTVTTDNAGRAAARGLRPNNIEGQYQIRVSASHEGQTASTVISQSNLIAAAAVAGAGISAKLIALLVVAGGAAAGGTAYALTRSGNSGGPPPTPASALTPGTPTVGPPR